MKKVEVIVQVWAEVGDITIYGIRTKQGWIFSRDVIDQSLMLLDEPTIQHSSQTVKSWGEALKLLDRYPWHKLSPRQVHSEFRQLVFDAVLERFKGEEDPWRLPDWKELCGIPEEKEAKKMDANENKVSTSTRLSVAWPPFAQKLAAVLAKLDEDQYLTISLKHSNQCVQFSVQGSFGLRMETTSNSYLAKSEQLNERQIATLIDAGWHVPTGTPADATPENDPDGSPNFFVGFAPPVPFDAVANLAVRTLSEILRVPHPAFLQYEAIDDREGKWEPIAFPDLGLKIKGRPPQADKPEDLSQLLLTALKETTKSDDLSYDEDGDIGIRYGSALTFVRLVDDPPFVRIFSAILRDVKENPDIFARLNDINANGNLARFIFRDGVIYAVADVSAVPFVSTHVVQAFAHLCAIADEMDSLLQEEFGGQTAFVESMPSSLKH